DGYTVTAPAGQFAPNAAGLYDLGGNASEWCHDYYDIRAGAASDVLRDPLGPASGRCRVVRGSSWRHGSVSELRFAWRDFAEKPRDDIGFRIARYAD
ncbi:MAG: SUMF1/EgtB/PvdO family nonheme iron enzyme, partial [Alphaproteobacteria bacterium]